MVGGWEVKNVLIHVGTRVGLEVGIVLIVTCPQKSGSFLARKVTAVLSEDMAIARREHRLHELMTQDLFRLGQLVTEINISREESRFPTMLRLWPTLTHHTLTDIWVLGSLVQNYSPQCF